MKKLPLDVSQFGARVLLLAAQAYREKLNQWIVVDEHRPPQDTAPVELVQHWRSQHEQLGVLEREMVEVLREFEIDESFAAQAPEVLPIQQKAKGRRGKRETSQTQDYGT